MTWGKGLGEPWGGGALIPTSQPLAEIAGLPTSFVFTDEADGALPGLWEPYQYLNDVGGGTITGQGEPAPDTHYRVAGGLGLWAYARNPLVGDPFLERGVAASPLAVLVGRNSTVTVIFRSPTELLDLQADRLFLEIGVGLRSSKTGAQFVGGRVRAEWNAGVWTEPMTLEAVSAAEAPPVVLATATLPDVPDPLDLWRNSQNHDLTVQVRSGELEVVLDGNIVATATVGEDGPAHPVIVARVFKQVGATIVPIPSLVGVQLQSLRDLERQGPPPQIEGDRTQDAAQLPITKLPMRELLDQKLFKRKGSHQFVAATDVETDVQGTKHLWPEGTVLRATEKYTGQEFLSVVADLAYLRAAREGGP